VLSGLRRNVDQLATLLLPGVRIFGSVHNSDDTYLLMACALRRMGYKYTWAADVQFDPPFEKLIQVVAQLRSITSTYGLSKIGSGMSIALSESRCE
jgi:hypothetical protein